MTTYGFGKDAPLGNSTAIDLVERLVAAIDAQRALDAAKDAVPNYTAQWSEKDYYQNELHDRNLAAAELLAMLKL